MIDSFVARFEGRQRKTNGGFLVRCPAHADSKPSLSIDERNGKIYLKCMAGCDTAAVLQAKGLTMADLKNGQPSPTRPQSITVQSLAASKGLPWTALTRFGVKNIRDIPPAERLDRGIGGTDGVWIPYFNPDGSIAGKTRIRTAHVAKDGSRWTKDSGSPVLPYGLHDVKGETQICICEGESDYWTLREAGLAALAIPGAQMVRSLQRSHLGSATALYVCQDSDAAGASFVAGVRQHVAPWGIAVFPLVMPDGIKDVNELYRRDVKGFADRLLGLMTAATTAGAPKPREFSTAGDIYAMSLPEFGLRLELDQIRRASWGALTGELLVTGEYGELFCAGVNVSDADKWDRVTKQVAARVPGLDVDWPGVMNDFAIRAQKADKAGKPAIWLADAPAKIGDEAIFEIDGVTIPRHHPACLFGDGGTGKSYIALYWAGVLARQGVNCLYIDAELDASEHRERLQRLYGETFPPILYLRLDRSLERAVEQIRRLVRDHNIAYAVMDSVGVLTQGAPESAEAANGYIRALRQIGIGSLSIAHVTKHGETNDQKPFGSVFYHNGFRSTWYAEQSDPDANDGAPLTIGLWHRKSNLTRRQKPVGLELDFLPSATVIRPVSMESITDLAHKQPAWKQVASVLRSGPKSAPDIAEEAGLPLALVKTELSKGKDKRFARLERGLWALA